MQKASDLDQSELSQERQWESEEGETVPRIAVVVGSSRPGRICPYLAEEARMTLQEGSRLEYRTVDLGELDLPLLDEPLMAALGQYAHDHTRAWSAVIDSFDGFFFVFPQYNWGYPAVLKNAIDFLYQEWRGKPASFLTYGNHGGSKAAGQFVAVMEGIKLQPLEHVEMVITRSDLDEDWNLKDPAGLFPEYRLQLRSIDSQFSRALATLVDTPVGRG